MYPFERFTESAKQMLTLAQQEAEKSHHSYIGTEHLVLAMTSQSGTVAAEALARLGVTHDGVRERIDAVLGRNERLIIQQIIPTSRVKTVIEMAFAEAQRLDSRVVATDHLLVAIVLEGQGIAAHVLGGMGATLDALREAIAAVKDAGVDEVSRAGVRVVEQTGSLRRSPLQSPAVGLVAAAAAQEAAADAVSQVSMEHVVRAIVKMRDGRIMRAFASLGIEEAQLIDALCPPQALVALRRSLRAAIDAKRDAVAREDYQAAASFLATEAELVRDLVSAEQEWDAPESGPEEE